MFDTYRSCLNATDEYGVENAHSIIRAQTNDVDTPEVMQRKVKAIFQNKTNQKTFRSQFSPPKSCIFSRNNLRQMKFLAANLIGDVFARIAELEDDSELGSSALDRMMKGFCPENSPINVYPLGYHTCAKPDPSRRCDMPVCFRADEREQWKIIEGCGHSFHELCLSGKKFCPICQHHIEKNVERLSKTAKSAIFELNSKRSSPKRIDNDTDDGLPRVKDVTPKMIDEGL